jgi:formylglycine-generating enzyme required for sulfatase activity
MWRFTINLPACLALLVLTGAVCAAEPLPVEGARAGDPWSGNALGMKFRWCPAGSFRMGSPQDEADRKKDEDQVEVTLTHGYWLGECEVTRGQWQQVMQTTWKDERAKRWVYDRIGEDPAKLAKEPDEPDLPMSYVNYDEAIAFCEALTKTEQAAGRLPVGWRYHLPTEAQWEYACRAGTTTRWSCGDGEEQLEKYASYRLSVHGQLAVGKLLPNAWGLCDMHGNVQELVRDGYQFKHPGGKDPFTPAKNRSSCYRGGDYGWGAHAVRSASRRSMWFGRRLPWDGFRVAIVPAEKPKEEAD